MEGRGGYDLEAIRAHVRLSELVGPDVAWDRRRSNAVRGDWWAPCPFHVEKTASFHVRDEPGVYYCFGCQARGDLFSYVMERDGVDFRTALGTLAAMAGIGPAAAEGEDARSARQARRDAALEARDAELRATAERRLAMAGEIWRQAAPDRVLLDQYLRARGVRVDALRDCYGGALPPSLRIHRDLRHFAGGREVHRGPAMVGLIARDRRFLGVHRTWITPAGRRELRGVKLDKQWLGLTGEMMGGAVRFSKPARRMIVGEGIETVLAVFSRLVERGAAGPDVAEPWSAEAALSLGALAGGEDPLGRGPESPATGRPLPSALPDWERPGWTCPDEVEELVILGEGSTKDPEAARRHALRAVRRHGRRADGSARTCCLALPGDWGDGLDFADLALRELAAAS